jgi:putative transposase
VLDAYVFESLSEVQALTDDWLLTYNERRPHDALGSIPPARFLPRPSAPTESSSAWCP